MKGTKTLLSYILFIIGLQWKTVYALPQGCQETEFMCENKRCILKQWKCDGEDDCGDNSDEKDCSTDHICDSSTDFKCYNGKCVPLSYTCDKVDDCGDGSDEETSGGPLCAKTDKCRSDYFQCNTTKRCITLSHQCDGIHDCGGNDLSDEENCKKKTCADDEFKCNNGNCISESWKCDHSDDCLDKSDELNCNNKTCPENKFKCHASGHCILREYRCDGMDDCLDGSDEVGCRNTTQPPFKKPEASALRDLTTTSTPCKTHQFTCPNSSKCIHKTWLCDGEKDCPDHEDESHDVCASNKCQDHQFRCKNGKCIENRDKCDGTNHCLDGSDEQNCPKLSLTCSQGTYSCKNSTKCIDPSNLCNGKVDCPNKDDEDDSCGVNECEDKHKHNCTHYCFDKKIGYGCKCRLGYELASDGRTCVDVNECLQSGMCSQVCINTEGGFVCKCDKGYFLDVVDKKTCRAQAPEPLLIITNRYDVRQISTNGKNYHEIAESRHSAAVAIDIKDEMIYWSDMGNKTINRIRKDRKGPVEIVIDSGLEKPDGIAIDWLSRKLYWSDTGKNTISLADLNGKNVKTIIQGKEGEEIRTLAVYPEKGFIYWTDWGVQPKMERADLSGKNRQTILDHNKVTWVSSIAIDHTIEKIFWTDLNKRRICSSDVDGKNLKEIVSGLNSPYGVTVFEDFVYWTEYDLKRLFKANKFNGLDKDAFGNYLVAPMGISVYHPLVQIKVSHPCESADNGGCSHLCFLTPNGKHECACPDNMVLNIKDGKTCAQNESRSEYQCHSSLMSIPISKKCDGSLDCPEHDDERGCPIDRQTVRPNAVNTNDDRTTIKIIVITAPIVAILLLGGIVVFALKKKRSRSDLRMIYHIDNESLQTKDKNGTTVGHYIPDSGKNNSKKLRSNKNFDNVNFRPDDAKLPLQMGDMYGDTIIDEYPGSDGEYDDRDPIIPHIV